MTATIKEIISIEDTRQYEEVGDTFLPVAGSGIEHECDRCGRFHEVHAKVLLTDGRTLTVGTGCMKKENPEMAKRFVNGDRAAKRLAALKSQLSKLENTLSTFLIIEAEVKALPLPEITLGEEAYPGGNSRSLRATMGDASVCYLPRNPEFPGSCWEQGFNTERKECLTNAWRRNRMIERGADRYDTAGSLNQKILNVKGDIRKTEERLSKI